MSVRIQLLSLLLLTLYGTQLRAERPGAIIKSLLVNVDIESSDQPVGNPNDYDTLCWHVAANIILLSAENSYTNFEVTIYNADNTIFKGANTRLPPGDIANLNVETLGLYAIPKLPLTVRVFCDEQLILSAPMNIEQDLEYGVVTLIDLVHDIDPDTHQERFRGFQDREWNLPITYPETRIKYWEEQIDGANRPASMRAELADNIGGSNYYEYDAVISPINVGALQTGYDYTVTPAEIIKQLSMRWTFCSWAKLGGQTVLQDYLWLPETGSVECRYVPKP